MVDSMDQMQILALITRRMVKAQKEVDLMLKCGILRYNP